MTDIYTLDANLMRSALIEGFSSFIWTERFNTWGDFELVIPSNPVSRALLPVGTQVLKDGSQYVMTIETITDAIADDGSRLMDITGRSMEATLLNTRVGMPAPGDLTTTPTWNLTGKPADIVRTMFNDVCILSSLTAQHLDALPFIQTGALNAPGSIPEPSASITVALNPDTLYNQIVLVCNTYDMGFRLIRNGDTSQIYFEVYTGDDRTADQLTRTPVIFSADLDNLSDSTILQSIANSYTVAYVFAQHGSATVYNPVVNQSAIGFSRRVLLVDASDITLAAGSALNNAMNIRGLQALAQNDVIFAFDGQIPQHGGFVYGVDYKLGDLVEQRDSSEFGAQMRVTEQIFISDTQGERSYPTLSVVQEVIPDSWIALNPALEWSTVPGTTTWNTF